MSLTSTPNATPHVFLENAAGRYRYSRVFTIMCWCIFAGAMVVPLATLQVFTDPSSSDMQNVLALIALIICPVLAVISCSLARNFREIQIDRGGITVLPYGFHVASEHIDTIRYGTNFAGVRTIKIEVNKPYRVFQMVLWSLGRKITLGFNPKLFTGAHSGSS